ncbi:MAG: hypothetical protein WB987_01650 [Candidatus Acidiferrales bacterium]
MPEWIHIFARGRATKENAGSDSPASPDELAAIARQMAADAVYGSFGEFRSSYWNGKWQTPADDLVTVKVDPEGGESKFFRVELSVNTDLYDISRGGLQHFLGVLAGDLFSLRVPGFSLRDFQVIEVVFPTRFLADLNSAYRAEAYPVSKIRESFGLHDLEPLLAFSFKPRVGLKQDAIRDTTLSVLKAGFHIVEFDTRYLDLRDKNTDFLVELAKEAAGIGRKGRKTRLSPNLSVSTPLALALCERFSGTSEPPYVIKVDGGFDGISTVQEVRRKLRGKQSPIITSYPLLREQLNSRIPSDTFVNALVQSGVDMIYPGMSPSVGRGTRELGTAERGALSQATRRYHDFVSRDWPMVTLAGGVYAGQLHALYELVGPRVAYFLGGAVSLHKQGPAKGADLCSRVLREAANHHHADASQIKDLSGSLITEIESAYDKPPGSAENTFQYVSPKDLLATISVPRW